MSNARRKKAKRQGERSAPRNSARMTKGEGAKAYDTDSLLMLRRLVPGVEIVHPLGIEDEGDKERLARARGMAGHNDKPYGAVVRVDILTTRYFQDLALNVASRIHIMRSKVQHEGAEQPCPFGTMVVVFAPRSSEIVRNGMAPIYWEA